MKSQKIAIALSILIIFFFSGCSQLQISPAPDQNTIYKQGQGCVIPLNKKGEKVGIGVVGVGAYPGGRATFIVYFHNHTKNSINFGLENILATDQTNKRIRIFTPQEITRQIRMQAIAQAMAIGLSAGCQSFAASQSSYTTYSGSYSGNANYNAYNSYGHPMGSLQSYQNGSVNGTVTTYNPAQAAMANQSIQANMMNQMAMVGNQLQGQLGIAHQMLATTTVPPDGRYSGLIIVNQSPKTNFKFIFSGQECDACFIEK